MASDTARRNHPVDDPADLSRKDYVTVLKRTVREVRDDDLSMIAQAVAFKIFLSLFPAAIAGMAIYGIVASPDQVIATLRQLEQGFLPREAAQMLNEPLVELASQRTSTGGFTAVAGVAAGLWAAIGAAQSIMKALNRAYEAGEDRKFVKAKLVAAALTVSLFLTIAALVLLVVVGGKIQDAIVPESVPWQLSFLISAARYVGAVVVLMLSFAFVYWAGPNRERPKWEWMSPGAVVGVLGWLAVAGGFTLYVNQFGQYQATYGALAGVVVLLIWLQLSILILLVGAEFNAELERMAAEARALGRGEEPTTRPFVATARVTGDVRAVRDGPDAAAGSGVPGAVGRLVAAGAALLAGLSAISRRTTPHG